VTVGELRQAIADVPGDFEVLGEAGSVGFDAVIVDDQRREVVLE
jgi:hypothetical protein